MSMHRVIAVALVVLTLVAVAASTALAATRPLYIAKCGMTDRGYLAVKPSGFNPGCVGASPQLFRLRWSGWGTSQVTAVGRADLNTCDPTCAAGNRVTYPARLVASRIRACLSGDRPIRLYTRTRLIFRYPAGNPFGEKVGWRGYTPPDTPCTPIAE